MCIYFYKDNLLTLAVKVSVISECLCITPICVLKFNVVIISTDSPHFLSICFATIHNDDSFETRRQKNIKHYHGTNFHSEEHAK